jgi:hypothetical protein
MSYRIPADPNMLYSFVNMMLRDRYDSLEEFCADNDADINEIIDKLQAAGYQYDRDMNQFR